MVRVAPCSFVLLINTASLARRDREFPVDLLTAWHLNFGLLAVLLIALVEAVVVAIRWFASRYASDEEREPENAVSNLIVFGNRPASVQNTAFLLVVEER